MDPYKTHEVYFDFKHSQFQKSLMGKHHNIKDKRIILFMKHLYLKNIVVHIKLNASCSKKNVMGEQ